VNEENQLTTEDMKTKFPGQYARRARGLKPLATARKAPAHFEEPDAAAPLLKLKNILVPVDFSAESLKALRYAVPFGEQFGATICLVHVVEPASFMNDLPNVVLAISDEDEAREAKRRLFSLAQKEIKELVPVDVKVRIGRPFHEIVTLAETLDIDLIIIATNGHTGLKHVFLGSTSERVIRYAPCPVLVVREKEREFVSHRETSKESMKTVLSRTIRQNDVNGGKEATRLARRSEAGGI
jgi:universal stress protein A